MVMPEAARKVTCSHLERDAWLYIRQSTMHQVVENTESTKRQYALRERAVALGWPAERVQVIDCDLGQSGASAADREGFKRLVGEVTMGHAGIVLGLEVSRLARNCTDWHRLLEVCALSDTLICDEDGLYDPEDFNDRLLLGLKGTMSEAELHLLRARLRGGLLNKARRGELATPLPTGFVYDERKQVRLDPDAQVRDTIHLLFRTFRRVGSAHGTVRHFRREGIAFPRRLHQGPRKGEVVWADLTKSRTRQVLHNPRYAGAFFYGRKRWRKGADGQVRIYEVPAEQWHALVPDAHEGFLSWEAFQENQRRLRELGNGRGADRRRSHPREGCALLQGLAVCGVCGRRMTVQYRTRAGRCRASYVCRQDALEYCEPMCQQIPGSTIDEAIGELLVATLTPMALEVSLAVQQELLQRLEEADRIRAQQVQRAQYEAELARQRFMQVDPNHRLVADRLEAQWNQTLRHVQAAQQECERQRQKDRLLVDEQVRSKVMALASDFPRLWKDRSTRHKDRKRMLRLLLEDVTLIKKEAITVHVRFKGGMTKTLTVPIPPTSRELRQTPPEVVQQVDALLAHHTDRQIAAILNGKGLRSGDGKRFHWEIVRTIRENYGLKSRYTRLREAGRLTADEAAEKLGIAASTVKTWGRRGWLKSYAHNDNNHCLYENPGQTSPAVKRAKRLKNKNLRKRTASNGTGGVV